MTRRLLTDFEIMILLAVLRMENDAYGVTIAREIEDKAGRTVQLPAIYAALDRLEKQGLVRSWIGEATPQRGGRAKKHFALTAGRPRIRAGHPRRPDRALVAIAAVVIGGHMSHPPRLATLLLNWLAPGNEALRGDLDEEFRNGRGSRWYWRQVAALARARGHVAHSRPCRRRRRELRHRTDHADAAWVLAVFVVNVTDWLLRFEGVQVLLRFPDAFGPFNGVAPILALALGAVTGRVIAHRPPIASSRGDRRVRRRDDAVRGRGAQGSDDGQRTGAVSSGRDTAGRHDRDVRAWVGRRHYHAGDPAADRAPRVARETVTVRSATGRRRSSGRRSHRMRSAREPRRA